MFSALFRSIVVFTMKRLLLGYSFHNSLISFGQNAIDACAKQGAYADHFQPLLLLDITLTCKQFLKK